MAMVIGLTVDVPRDGPDLWVNVLQQAGLEHVFFEEGAGDGGEGFDGDKDVGAGGAPGRAVLGEAPARGDIVDVGVVLELRPQVCRTPVNPGRSVPMKRSSLASRLRAVAEACNMAWYARR